ncbi:MAG: DUF1592 domain-containing protein [Pirellulaceae bacterium]|nr:DUF1592 domain-containing protein [Pirellulaceae bacterium]
MVRSVLTLMMSWLVFAGSAATLSAQDPATQSGRPRFDPAQVYVSRVVPLLKKYCLECHGPDVQEAEIGFHDYKTVAKVTGDLPTWTRVLQMIETGVMPPDDSPQPTAAERKGAVNDLEKILFNVDCDGPPDPGRVTIRRLNRAEYNNTVRDLLGVKFQPADDFPSDDVGSGFDNIGEVLTLPPLLMEKYLAAAERIAETTIVTDPALFVQAQRRDRRQLSGEGAASYSEDRRRWTMASEGSVSAKFDFPRAGQYQLRVSASSDPAGDEPAQMELRLGGKKLKVFDVNATRSPSTYELKVELPDGEQQLVAAFINDYYDPNAKDKSRRDRNLHVYSFEIDGPLDFRPEDYPEFHRKLIAVVPQPGQLSPLDAAKTNLRPLLNRAFRRKATDDEVNQFARLAETAVGVGDTFEQGMQIALTAVLVSPHFLFRVEGQPPGKSSPQAVRDLGPYELASRLSYFLWSSLPDDELFAAATRGDLARDDLFEKQIRRMLADPKSEALVQNFATQWLNLRLLDSVTPDPRAFPEFNRELRADMRRETELFAAAIVREDRSILDFLEGRFTFVNERLARHYGLPDVRGEEFQRVSFTDDRHSGVLTQASILTLTSNPGRTSPVKRGKWILENILGTPPPDPPADVPELEATQRATPSASLREQLSIHRSNAVCASCHKTMDELGFGLENFDAVGRWREKDGKFAVDSSGKLPSGEAFRGPVELAQTLKRRKADFGRCLAEKMLVFALGRGFVSQDRCATDRIVEELEKHDYRFSALVVAIAQSVPFRKTRGEQP